ncbi:LOW QUALITY PROTEIN: aldo-keto reductase family 1 member A1-A [Limanda limanda]|uniref:LOW QUALITY PROTEIN: aldo-keto reductase family 1 member A1-A n=1 Tax=Limanda limanda TaxID=27771 RepID=UPI0029C9180E|nr:LOW QUALITY PROTEIN: aldo-keto reductase family 1 member A1-A [Limanda limanda]
MSRFVTLSTGQKMPVVGLGTWKSAPGPVKQAVLAALDCGYRHIDCAAAYSNQLEVGEALTLRVGPGKSMVTAYSPMGSVDRPCPPDQPSLLEDPRLAAIAQRYQKTPAQVILRWHIHRGVGCIPKSVTPSRIQQNLQVLDFSLTDDDMKQIESFDRKERFIVPTLDGKSVWRDAEHPHFPFHDFF